MVRESSRINQKRENQPLVEYMPVSSPTKCIACSLNTYRGPLYPIFFIFLASLSSYRPSKIHGPRKFTNQPETRKSASSRIYARFKPNKVHRVLPRYLSRRPVPHLLHFFLRLRLHINPQRWLSCVYYSALLLSGSKWSLRRPKPLSFSISHIFKSQQSLTLIILSLKRRLQGLQPPTIFLNLSLSGCGAT